MEEESHKIRVVLDVQQQLYREMLEHIIVQQTDMHVFKYVPDATEVALWKSVKMGLDESRPEDRLVVISSFEEPEEEDFKRACDRLLMEFPGVLIVAINWQAQKVSTLRNEVRCEQIPSSLRVMIGAMRNMRSPTHT